MINSGRIGMTDPLMAQLPILDDNNWKRWFPECAGSFSDPRVRTVFGDGRDMVSGLAPGWADAFFLDLPDPEGQVAGFYCAEFFGTVRGLLAKGGGMALQCGPLFFRSRRVSAIFADLCRVFPSVSAYLCHVPSYGGECLFAMASESLPVPSAGRVAGVFSERGVGGLKRCSPGALAAMFELPPWARDSLWS